MLPHLGAGVGQGFEDVYVLCRLLEHPQTNLTNLDVRVPFSIFFVITLTLKQVVLEIYDKLRTPRANMVLERSITMGKIYDNYGPGPGNYNTEDMRRLLTGKWEPVWHHDLKAEVDETIHKFECGIRKEEMS